MKQSAKLLKYLGFVNACNVAFGVFMATWVVTRHYLYNVLCWSIIQNVPARMKFGCYSGATGEFISESGYSELVPYLSNLFQDRDSTICMNSGIKYFFLAFLVSIQGLSIIWFRLIARIAWGVVCGSDAEDVRSDEEDEVEDDVEIATNSSVSLDAKETAGAAPIANEAATGLDHRRTNGSASVRARGRGRVPFDQSDRKALLGRIGCDKPT